MRLHPYVCLSKVLTTASRRNGVRMATLSVLILSSGMAANRANAQNQYFTNSLTTGSTYSWDGANWSVPGGTSSGPFASTWSAGDFARFYGTSATNYTVTVGADESMAGMYLNTGTTAVSLTINQSSAAGSLDITPGVQGFIGTTGDTITINAPIVGTGGIDPQVTSGTLNLYGTNTYSGGTTFTFSSNLVDFNNNSSFGTGIMTNSESASSFAPLIAVGGKTITLANNFTQGANSGAGFNFAANANTPVVSTGTWSLGASNLNLRNNGSSTSPLTLSGVISGTANMIVSGANGGSITFSGANTYSGTTTIGVTGDTAITLKLGAANTIASTSSLILAGGTLNPDGINQAMTATTLGLTASSSIDFGVGASEMDFANSSGLTWAGTLNLVNYSAGLDAIRFGTGSTGLTAAQLGRIEFNGAGLGSATLDANGFLGTSAASAPEPASWALLAAGSLTALAGVAVAASLRKGRTPAPARTA